MEVLTLDQQILNSKLLWDLSQSLKSVYTCCNSVVSEKKETLKRLWGRKTIAKIQEAFASTENCKYKYILSLQCFFLFSILSAPQISINLASLNKHYLFIHFIHFIHLISKLWFCWYVWKHFNSQFCTFLLSCDACVHFRKLQEWATLWKSSYPEKNHG